MKISRKHIKSDFIHRIEEISGEKISACYQCGKCSAGCPMAQEMEVLPHQVIRYLHLGAKDKALKSKSIWLCASCHSCSSRCPQSFDLANMMEALRLITLRAGRLQLRPEDIDTELLEKAPQQAFVSAFRKYSN